MKKAFLLFVMLLLAVLTVSSVSALPVVINHVWVDGTEVYETGTNKIRSLDRNQALPVKVELEVDTNLTSSLKDVQVEAVIRGYDQKDLIEDITDAFDAQSGVTYVKNLDLKLPIRMDQDRYKLRVRIEDRDGETTEETFELEVEAASHSVWIRDVVLSPSDSVVAGRALLARVRVKNVGNSDENDGIRVTFAIPDLGVSDTDYIDELNEDESTTSEDLYVRIPACVTQGLYTWYASVTYQDGDETETVNGKILVMDGDVCPSSTQPEVVPTTIIAVGSASQVANGGSEVVYPITITNQEGAAKTYVVSVDSGDWATFSVSPSNLMLLQKGETGTIFVHAKVSQTAPAGDNLFVVNIKKGAELIKQVTLKANVVQTSKPVVKPTNDQFGWDAVKQGLLIALIVLIIILIIIGLIIGFKKVKSDDETNEKGESYY
jgi:hypothetical protein